MRDCLLFSRLLLPDSTESGSPESVSKQPTQLIVEFNSSLRHIIVTSVFTVSVIVACCLKSLLNKLFSRDCVLGINWQFVKNLFKLSINRWRSIYFSLFMNWTDLVSKVQIQQSYCMYLA